MPESSQNQDIILFDGVCNLCNNSVNFIIDRDPKSKYLFASLQSEIGQKKMKEVGLDPNKLNSIVLIENGKVFQKSTAALKIAGNLTGLWFLCQVFFILPSFLRDFFYDIIAKNRYRWFGKEDACRMPSPELKARFLE
ncbi:MAG: thiol-disulfide oxidoreductase DCC family protein [Flammeovirgaceae bacterium]